MHILIWIKLVAYSDLCDHRDKEEFLQFVWRKFDVDKKYKSEIQKKLITFHKNFVIRWNKSNRSKNIFKYKYNNTWMQGKLYFAKYDDVPKSDSDKSKEDSKMPGRPTKLFCESSERSKRRKVSELGETTELHLLQKSYSHALRTAAQTKQAKLIDFVSTASPEIIDRMIESIEVPVNQSKLTSEEGLAIFLDAKLTKHSYNLIRSALLKNNFDALPPYYTITVSKQQTIPDPINVTESSACVELQSLLDKTAESIMRTKSEEEIDSINNKTLVMLSKWGCDGSSGQSEYKQGITEGTSDTNLFMLSLVPLRITQDDSHFKSINVATSSQVKTVWKNPCPGSTKYCRPIKFEYTKETKEKTKMEVDAIKIQTH